MENPQDVTEGITPQCPRGHGNMNPVTNDYGQTLYHQCKNCYLTDEHPMCKACGEEIAFENYCSACLMDIMDDYSEYI